MKKLFCLIGLIGVTTSSLMAQAGNNPIFPGYYADPEGVVFGDTYWIYPTFSALYEDQIFLDAFSSKDLVNWTKHERIIDTTEVKWAKYAMWAPAAIEKDGEYFLFFAANDIQSDEAEGGIGVAVASKPEGPFKDHLGKPLIDKFYNGAQPIDQFVFEDVDGTYYMFYGGWRHCNVVKLNDDFTGFVPFENGEIYKEVTPENYVEGPFMFRKDGKYYFMWSEGGWGLPNYKVAYAISDSPTGPFERQGVIMEQDPDVATSAGHHSVIQVPGEERYYIVYHRRPKDETARDSRVVSIEEMFFDEDTGHIKPVKLSFEGVQEHRIKNVE